MPGSPIKRSTQEREAIKRLEITARNQADENARKIGRPSRYTPELAQQVIDLIAGGVPFEDSVLNGAVLSPGVASRVSVDTATIYRWQEAQPPFREAIARARVESANRIADRMLSLADAALAEPALANSVRVAADILKWQAMVRNPHAYGARQQVDVRVETIDLGDRLRRARERVIDGAAERVPAEGEATPMPAEAP